MRNLVQGPPVDAPVEVKIQGQDITVLRNLGDEVRSIMANLDLVTQARASVNGGNPQIRFEIDEVKARLLGLDVADIAGQLDTALVGITGGSLIEGTEQLPVRVRLGDEVRSDLSAIVSMPILLPNAPAVSATGVFPAVPLSELARPVLEPAESTITRTDGVRENTIQAFIVPGVLPEEALQDVLEALDASGFVLPQGYSMSLGGDSDARSNTVGNSAGVCRADCHLVDCHHCADLQFVPPDRCDVGRLCMLSAGTVDAVTGRHAIPIRDHRDHWRDWVNRCIDQRGDHHSDWFAKGPGCKSGRSARHGAGCVGIKPPHHLDNHHHVRRVPSPDPWRGRVLAALCRGNRRGCFAVDRGVFLLHAALLCDVVPKTVRRGMPACHPDIRARQCGCPACRRIRLLTPEGRVLFGFANLF